MQESLRGQVLAASGAAGAEARRTDLVREDAGEHRHWLCPQWISQERAPHEPLGGGDLPRHKHCREGGAERGYRSLRLGQLGPGLGEDLHQAAAEWKSA